ncbi:MAG TPA: hypothetical protein VKY22_28345 [Bradyrhizobium sp.]|nr:hypothetical protein [Bradyrhizobium sp.]
MVSKKATPPEEKCEACDGTGFPPVMKAARPGRRIYPPPCAVCGGKGHIITQLAKRMSPQRD